MKLSDIKYIAIHASATKPTMNVDARWIQDLHRKKGWSEIGYHYVICRDGFIERGGRMMYERGAHVRGFNNVSIGVCLVGGIDNYGRPENNYTKAQFKALKDLLIEFRMFLPDAIIQGHRDFYGDTNEDGVIDSRDWLKDCPCFEVRDWMAEAGL